jgi:hypothetical protein
MVVAIAHFDALGSLTPVAAKPTHGDFIHKKILIMPAGRHKSNDGREHNITPEDIQEYAYNTNLAMDRGVELPLIFDHAKKSIREDGKLAKFGEVISDIVCRVVTERDLPNPKMRHLLGEVAAFAEVEIRDRVSDVQKGLIKLLSPGLNLEEKRFVEVSSVLFPAIHGPALFSAALDYKTIRKQSEEFGQTERLLDPRYADFLSALRNIDSADNEQLFGNDKNALRLQAINDFRADLVEVLGLDELRIQPERLEDTGYNPDPYGRQLFNPINPNNATYSEEKPEPDVLGEFVLPLKRRRRTAAFSKNGGLKTR